MVDYLYGSYYVQSAIDLAVDAKMASSKVESIRLYNAAICDMLKGIEEIEAQSYEITLGRAKSLVEDAEARIDLWERTIHWLKSH